MSCRRAEEIDLMAFATDRGASEWAEFRAHYPGCSECSRAVAELGALESLLAAHGPSAGRSHLTEDEMLAAADETLPGPDRMRVEGHLSQCAACRSELSVLRRFSLDAATAPLPSAPEASLVSTYPEAARDGGDGWLSELAALLGGLLRPGPALGLAAALALVLVLWATLGRDGDDPQTPRYVEQPAPGEASPDRRDPNGRESDSSPLEQGILEEGRVLAEQGSDPGASAPESSPDPTASPDLRLAETPKEVAEPPLPEVVPPSAPEPALPPDESAPREREVVLLAALLPSEMPAYVRPGGDPFDAYPAMRIAGSVRSGNGARPGLSVLAPAHLGSTRQASPRLSWVLDRAIASPVEVVLSDPASEEPLLEKTLSAPLAAGLHSIDLSEEGVVLVPETTYEWSVAVVVDPQAREHDVVSQAAIRRRSSAGPTGTGSEGADRDRARTIHRLASEGDWYDALDRVNRWIDEGPELERLRRYRRSLLEQAELGPAIDWLDPPDSG